MCCNKLFQALISANAVLCGFFNSDVQASSVSPSELFISDPTEVLMVDGKDRDPTVSIRVRLDTPNRAAFDFGFMSNDNFLPITGKPWKKGGYTFAGGPVVDFALRNKGADGLFNTSDDLIYRLSDSAGYAKQDYFAPVSPAKSRLPVVSEFYFQDLKLTWDLNLDGKPDAHALLEIKGSKYDGMMPAQMVVSLPATAWLLGSGLAVLGVTAQRRKRAA